jgi:tetratricopeptide (TPR) repeat protein
MERSRWSLRLVVASLLAAGTFGCLFPGLSEEEQQRLDVYLNNAQAYYGKGKLLQSEQQFRKALEIDPSNETAALGLGWSLLRQDSARKIREAQEVLSDLVRRTPDDFRAVLGLGTARYREALALDEEVQRLLALDGDHEAEIRESVARRRSLLDEAKRDFERVLDLREDYSHALANLGQIAALEGETEKAFDYLERYLVLAEQTRRYFETKKGRLVDRDAIEIANEKIATNIDKEITVRDLMANLYFDDGQPEKAIDQLSRILALKPDFGDAYLHRARCWEKLGRYDLAIQDLERFLRATDRKVDDPMVLRANALLVDFRSRS